jgi:hypothetical protein
MGDDPGALNFERNVTPSALQPGDGKYTVSKWSIVSVLGNVSLKDSVTFFSENGKYRVKRISTPPDIIEKKIGSSSHRQLGARVALRATGLLLD